MEHDIHARLVGLNQLHSSSVGFARAEARPSHHVIESVFVGSGDWLEAR